MGDSVFHGFGYRLAAGGWQFDDVIAVEVTEFSPRIVGVMSALDVKTERVDSAFWLPHVEYCVVFHRREVSRRETIAVSKYGFRLSRFGVLQGVPPLGIRRTFLAWSQTMRLGKFPNELRNFRMA